MHGDVNALLDQVRDREPQAATPATAAASAARRRDSERERRSTVAELSQEDLSTARRRMTEVSRNSEAETNPGNLELPQGSKDSKESQDSQSQGRGPQTEPSEPTRRSFPSESLQENENAEEAPEFPEPTELELESADGHGGVANVEPPLAPHGDPRQPDSPQKSQISEALEGSTKLEGAEAQQAQEGQQEEVAQPAVGGDGETVMEQTLREEDLLAAPDVQVEQPQESAAASAEHGNCSPQLQQGHLVPPVALVPPAPPNPFPPSRFAVREAVVSAVLAFRPTLEQLAVRLQGLVEREALEASDKQAERVESLLNRWGLELSEGEGGMPPPTRACLAILSRDLPKKDGSGPCPSALDMSVQSRNYPVTNVLLRYVPQHLSVPLIEILNGQNPFTGQSLLYAAVRYSNRYTLAVVDGLLVRRADINGPGAWLEEAEAMEPMVAACVRRADLPLVERVLWHQADVNAKSDGKPILQIAVERGSEEILLTLLRSRCDVNATNRIGRTALVAALRTGRPPFPLAQQLLAARCDASQADSAGVQPLLHTASIPEPGIHTLLLAHAADPNAVASPATDRQARLLHVAAQAKNETMLKCLLEAAADANAPEGLGRTVLHLAVSQNLSNETMAAILHARGDPNIMTGQGSGGETPLRLAVLAQSPAKVVMLLEARASANGCNFAGCTALQAALCSGDSQRISDFLLASGADPQFKRRTLLTSQEFSHISSLDLSHTVPTVPPITIQPFRAEVTMGIHPKYLAETWSKARFRRRRVVRPAEQIEDFDPLCPLTLPPLERKFNRTAPRQEKLPWRTA